MTGAGKKAYDIIFVAIVATLFVFKYQDFKLPYFWDELGVYAQAADYQFQHHLSLTPASVPAELSRGHPLFFTFMNAVVWRIFGEHVLVAHLFCFSISVLLLLAVYLKSSRYFNPLTAIVSVLILAMQPIFLAQSCLVLPEITLALFCFMAVCSYYENKFLLFSVFAGMAVLTKEPAIVLPAAVLLYSLLRWAFSKAHPGGLNIGPLICTLMPYLIFALFLIVQKGQNGWYFFPYHLKAVSFNWNIYYGQLCRFTSFILQAQGRLNLLWLITISLLLFSLLNKWKNNRNGRSFIILSLLFGAVFLGFSSLFNFYMGRYTIALLAPFSILAGVSMTLITRNGWLIGTAVLVFLIINLNYLEERFFNYDADLGYRRPTRTLQQAINYIQATQEGKKITGNFPAAYALEFDQSGYLNRNEPEPAPTPDQHEYYYLFCEPGGDVKIDQAIYKLNLLRTFQDGFARVRVFRVTKKR